MAYSGYGFQGILYLWESWGLSDILLPFLLVFAVVFAALEKGKVLGQNKKVHTIIALVLGLTLVIPHITGIYPQGADAVNIINTALPQIAVVIVAIVMVMILIGLIGYKWKPIKGIAGLISFIALLIIFARAAGWLPSYEILRWLEDPAIQSTIIILLVFGLAIFLITGGPTSSSAERKSFFDKLMGGED